VEEFPKYLPLAALTVNNQEELDAVNEGRAVLETISSAQGDTIVIKSIKPREDGLIDRLEKAFKGKK
jgi:hypothetical protein